jgi:predicted transglutaminase-like cysteine proteinase
MGLALVSAVSAQAANAVPLKPVTGKNKAVEASRSATAINVFGTLALKTQSKRYAKQWKQVQRRVRSEASLYERCDQAGTKCHSKVRAWRKSIRKMSRYKSWDLLAAVNGKVNQLIRYADDAKHFGHADYWASPVESLTGRGDCEDYVILKYFTLAELGVPEHQMRIVIVRDKIRRIGHAVLAVKMNGKTYILDSLRNRPQVHTAIKRYKAYFSLNRQGSWVNVAARKRSTRVAAVKLPRQTPQEAQALLPDYAKKQPGARSAALRGSISPANPIQ